MDSDSFLFAGTVIWFFFLLAVMMLHAVRAAFLGAAETEIESVFNTTGSDPSQVLYYKNHMFHLNETIWFYEALLCLMSIPAWREFSRIIPGPAAALLIFVLIFLAAHSVPSLLGRHQPVRRLLHQEKTLLFLGRAAFPFVWILHRITEMALRLFGVRPDDLENEVTEDEILSMVNEGHEQGVIDADESEMIQNIFELDEKEAKDIMTHRTAMIGIEGTMTLDETLSFMVGERVSRFPVYEDNIDHLLGILYIRDVIRFHTMEIYDDKEVRSIPDLLREVVYVPETRSIRQLFRSMQESKLQMVIVMDEYGQTAGLVTMEDILEEIVGNIQDEYDKEEQHIQKGPENGFYMDGLTPLDEAGEALGVEFPEDHETLNGFLISRLERVPEDGEQFVIEELGYRFHVTDVSGHIIRHVMIRPLTEAPSDMSNDSVSKTMIK